MPPKPHRFAKPMQRRIVGSSCIASAVLGLSQSTVSHHLKVLVDAGHLTVTKRGTWHYYRLVPGALNAIAGVLTTV
jgi:ArsR family transcriptional regulator